jgi:hypothetical protein
VEKQLLIQVRPAYDLTPPNEGLPYKGGLPELCRPIEPGRALPPPAFRVESTSDTWVDPAALEALLDGDAQVRAIAAASVRGPLSARGTERALGLLAREIDRVVETELLPQLLDQFTGVRLLVAQYVLAKAAARALHPRRFEEKPK